MWAWQTRQRSFDRPGPPLVLAGPSTARARTSPMPLFSPIVHHDPPLPHPQPSPFSSSAPRTPVASFTLLLLLLLLAHTFSSPLSLSLPPSRSLSFILPLTRSPSPSIKLPRAFTFILPRARALFHPRIHPSFVDLASPVACEARCITVTRKSTTTAPRMTEPNTTN